MLKMPDSMDECLYFTRRSIGDGQAVAWVCRKECPQCHKAKMGKPVEGGKVKIRAKEYKCPECGFTEEKTAHEESCTLEVMYTCPYCKHEGEAATEYKKKLFEGMKAYVFSCGKCGKKIGITKKMKDKGGAEVAEDE